MIPQEGFLTSVRTAYLFFRVCRRYKVDRREDRIALMREITRRGKANYIRDVAPLLEGKRVVKIAPKKDTYEN